MRQPSPDERRWIEQVLSVTGGAEVATGPDVVVLQTAPGGTVCRRFADGFESAGVLAWLAHVP